MGQALPSSPCMAHCNPESSLPSEGALTKHPGAGSGLVPTRASGIGAFPRRQAASHAVTACSSGRLGAVAAPACPACPSAGDSPVPRALKGHQADPPRGMAVGAWVPGQGHPPGHPTGGLLTHPHPLGELLPSTQGTPGLWSPRPCPPQRPACWHRATSRGHTPHAAQWGHTSPGTGHSISSSQHGAACHGTAQRGTARHGTARHGTAQHAAQIPAAPLQGQGSRGQPRTSQLLGLSLLPPCPHGGVPGAGGDTVPEGLGLLVRGDGRGQGTSISPFPPCSACPSLRPPRLVSPRPR